MSIPEAGRRKILEILSEISGLSVDEIELDQFHYHSGVNEADINGQRFKITDEQVRRISQASRGFL